LPSLGAGDPSELVAFAKNPGDKSRYEALAQAFRASADWGSMVKLNIFHAQALGDDERAADLMLAAAELAAERQGNRTIAAHALALAWARRGDHSGLGLKLLDHYRNLGWHRERLLLLDYLVAAETRLEPALQSKLHTEAAEIHWEHYQALSFCLEHLRRAIELDPQNREAVSREIELFLLAGAWEKAAERLRRDLDEAQSVGATERIAQCQVQLAYVEREANGDPGGAARHLQLALEANPGSITALHMLGELFTHARAGDERAAPIYLKTARAAAKLGDEARARGLCWRTLEIDPLSAQAVELLSGILERSENWSENDRLLAHRIDHAADESKRAELLLERGKLLETQLQKSYQAELCFERASQVATTQARAQVSLLRLARENLDHFFVVEILERELALHGDETSIDVLMELAKLHRDVLEDPSRAALYDYKILEREIFHESAAESYKEHFRRRHSWAELRDLLAFRIDQAERLGADESPLGSPKFAEEYAELADLCERRLGDLDGALDAWRRLARSYPEDQRPQEHIARIEKRIVMWDNMLESLESDLAKASDASKRIELLRRLTQIYRDRFADPARAIELYRELLQLTPEDQQSRRALLGLYERAGDHKAVVATLHEQSDRSQAVAETAAYLRRIIDLCQHQLDDPEQALAACEKLTSIAPKSVDVLRRLQQIHLDRSNFSGFANAVARECELLIKPDTKAPALRRLARVQLAAGLIDDALGTLAQLHALFPARLECADRYLAAALGFQRKEAAQALLEKLADSPHVPAQRRVDYLGQLGEIALENDHDIALAVRSFERLIALAPNDIRGLSALRTLYRRTKDFSELNRILERLVGLTPFDDEKQVLTREQARLLGDELQSPAEAAKALRALQRPLIERPRELISEILEHLRKTNAPRPCAAQLELLLLGETTAKGRKDIYHQLVEVWRESGEVNTALAVHRRHLAENPGDLDAMQLLAELQLELNDIEGALHTLEGYGDALGEIGPRIAVLNRLANLAEEHGQATRALEYHRKAIELDLENDNQWEMFGAFSERHGSWPQVMQLMQQRADNRQNLGDIANMRQICVIAAQLAEDRLEDAATALQWLKRSYLATLDDSPERKETEVLLVALADRHRFHAQLLEIWRSDLEARHRRGAADTVFCGIDLIGAYLRAAKLARDGVHDPEQAVALLMHGWRELDEHEKLAEHIEEIASAHNLWQSLLDVQDSRLSRRSEPEARWEVYCKISDVLVDRANDPLRAFGRLREAWKEFSPRESDARLATHAHEALVALGQRYELWDPLALHFVAMQRHALERQNFDESVDASLQAAALYHQKLDRPLEALRLLVPAVSHDPDASRVLPRIRELAAELFRDNDAQTARLGALIKLEALARQLAVSTSQELTIELLRERATLREEELVSRFGALAEWMRIIQIEPGNAEARASVGKLCQAPERANFALFLPAWDLQNATVPGTRHEQLLTLAEIYEEHLGRPEYALRCRLQAWRVEPKIPDPHDIDDATAQLWRLAERVGSYRGPALPEEGLLFPRIPVPEREDQAVWASLDLDPASFFSEEAAPVAPPSAAQSETPIEDEMEILELDAIEEMLEEDEEDAADGDPTDAPRTRAGSSSASFEIAKVEHEGEELTIALTPMERSKQAPPARLGQIIPGQPAVPYLSGPILPARPRVESAWHEIAAAYDARPDTSANEEVALLRVLAKMWETSAARPELAFDCLERALLRLPGHELALQEVHDLATRGGHSARLRRTLMYLLQHSKSKDIAIDLSLRLAKIHAEQGDTSGAEQYYRHIVSLDAQHAQSLEALCAIYQSSGRFADHAEVYAQLLDVQRFGLADDERIARAMHLAELYANELGQRSDAIAALRFLLDDFPHYLPAQEFLVALLLDGQQWAQAIEAMRLAIESSPPHELEVRFLQKIAEVYAEHMHLPDRAIEAWQAVREREPNHELALTRLRQLLQSTHRYDQHIRLVEELLSKGDKLTGTARLELILDKAEAEFARTPHDATAAREDLNRLREGAVLPAGLAIRAADLMLACNDPKGAEELIRHSLDAGGGELAVEDRARLIDALLAVLKEAKQGPRTRLDELKVQQRKLPESRILAKTRVALAKELGDAHEVLLALESQGDTEALIEAGELALDEARDAARSMEIFKRLVDGFRGSKTGDASDPARVEHESERAILGLARAQISLGLLDEALAGIDAASDAVDSARSRARLLGQVGQLVLQQGGDPEVLSRIFTRSLELDPGQISARIGLGQLLQQRGELTLAEDHLVAALDQLEIEPQAHLIAQATLVLAAILERSQREIESHRRLMLAARVAPDDLRIRRALAENRFQAGKWREVLASADAIDAKIAQQPLVDAQQVEEVVRLQILAARAEVAVHRQQQAIERLERGLRLHPSHVGAREALVEILRQSQQGLRAGQELRQLAALRSDASHGASDRIRACLCTLDALRTVNTDESVDTQAEVSAALAGLGEAIHSARGWTKEFLEDARRQGTFPFDELQQCVEQVRHLDPALAAEGILVLARAEERPSETIFTLLLATAGDMQSAAAGPEERKNLVDLAISCAREARRIRPDSAQALRYLVQALDHAKSDHPDLDALLSDARRRYLEHLPVVAGEREAALDLLRRAGTHTNAPTDEAHRALSRVAELAPSLLTVSDRLRILEWDELAQVATTQGGSLTSRYLINLQAIVEQAPYHRPALARWAHHLAGRSVQDRAHAAYSLLAVLDPSESSARSYLAAHPAATTSPSSFDVDAIIGTPPPDAGVAGVLGLLYEGALDLIVEHFRPAELSAPLGQELVGRLGETASKCWQELTNMRVNAANPYRVRVDPRAVAPLHIELAGSPVIVIGSSLADTSEERLARFWLAHGIAAVQPQLYLTLALFPREFSELISGTLLAFHPRHTRRRLASRDDDERSTRLGLQLARRVPMRLARQLERLFKAHEDEFFDTRTWRTWCLQASDRAGLAYCGAIGVATEAVVPERTHAELAQVLAQDERARALAGFYLSESYARSRRQLGESIT
jgi:tetratricopeptide (TPR) repeat protein